MIYIILSTSDSFTKDHISSPIYWSRSGPQSTQISCLTSHNPKDFSKSSCKVLSSAQTQSKMPLEDLTNSE